MDNLALDLTAEKRETGSTTRTEGGNDLAVPTSPGGQCPAVVNGPIGGESEGRNVSWLSSLRKFHPSQGVLLALTASLFYTGVDVTMELATREVESFLVLCLFTSVIILLSSVSILVTRSQPPKTVKQFRVLLACGGCYAAGATFLVSAISKMPVGDAVSILHSLPIFAGIFGWVILRQPLRVIDIFFSLLCITGVTLIARPSFIFRTNDSSSDPDAHDEFFGALYAIASAVSFALSFVTGKVLRDLEVKLFYILLSNSCITFTCNVIICTASRLWTAPNPPHYWAIVLASGFLGFVAQLTVFWAFQVKRAVIVSAVLTSEIILTFVMQILFIHITPHWYSAIGAACIIVTCVGMATREEESAAAEGMT